jgi:hypothetical protein
MSLGLVLLAAEVRADPFIVQPDGTVMLNSTLTTTGVFTCRHSQCSGSGTNTVTFENQTGSATITFTGVDIAMRVTNHWTPVTLGSFVATATPGFTFPERNNKYNPVIHFGMLATQGDPAEGTFRKGWNFGPGGMSVLPVLTGTSTFHFRLLEDSEFGYSAINYTVRPFPFSLPSNGRLNLEAQVGVVPEPASLLLLGSGLAGALMARRRSRLAKGRT